MLIIDKLGWEEGRMGILYFLNSFSMNFKLKKIKTIK